MKRIKQMALVIASGLLGASLSMGSAGAVTVSYFDNRTDFSSEGVTQTETFTNNQLSGLVSITSSVGRPLANLFFDRLTPGRFTRFTFANAVNGFGADFNLAGVRGQGLGIAITLGLENGSRFSVPNEIPRTIRGSFFGLTTDTAFTSITFTSGTQGGRAETYILDNITTLTTPTTAVPLPASGILLAGLVIGGFAYGRRRFAHHRPDPGATGS